MFKDNGSVRVVKFKVKYQNELLWLDLLTHPSTLERRLYTVSEKRSLQFFLNNFNKFKLIYYL